MAHPQSSPRGLWAKNRFDIGPVQLLGNDDANALVFGNPVDALPSNVNAGAAITMISNSTGNALALNLDGTAWAYLSVTSVQPT